MSEKTNNKITVIDFPESIDNAITNLSDIPTKNIGQTFGDLWYLVFGGISHAADKKRMRYSLELAKYQTELSKSINSIPNDKRIEPSIHITAQALENSKYCISSSILRQMFVNLISGTMNSDLEEHVHPSFPEILKQLSENDALMLQILKQKNVLPIANIGFRPDKESRRIIFRNISSIIPDGSSVNKCAVSISSLVRTGLVSTTFSEYLTDETMYEPIKKISIYSEIETQCIASNKELLFQKGICNLTPLGNEFILSCVS